MAFPTIVFDTSTGSDTAASGAGPATALSGTAAATAASTLVTLSVDNPDLSGVATDGSAAIWVASSSGKRWAKITAVNNGTKVVTVANAYANTESGKSWGIGGKRATLDGSTRLGLDVLGGWTIDLQDDQTITANFNITPAAVLGAPFTFTSTVGTRSTKVQTSTNAIYGLDIQNSNNVVVSNLYFKSTAGTPGSGIGNVSFGGNCTGIIISNCIIDGFTQGIQMGDPGTNQVMRGTIIEYTEIKNCLQSAVWNSISPPPTIDKCYIHHNGFPGTSVAYSALGTGGTAMNNGSGSGQLVITRTVFADNASRALYLTMTNASAIIISECDFYKNCGGSYTNVGIDADILFHESGSQPVLIRDCNFYGTAAGNFALKYDGSGAVGWVVRNCSFGVYTTPVSGTNVTTGISPVTLSNDPENSSTDFGKNAVIGGGISCRSAAAASLFTANPVGDIGAVPSGGGATSVVGPKYYGMAGGFQD